MIALYMVPLFTDWVKKTSDQYKFGWVFVYLMIPLFVINISYVILKAMTSITKTIKYRKYNAWMKEKNKAEEKALHGSNILKAHNGMQKIASKLLMQTELDKYSQMTPDISKWEQKEKYKK